MEPLKAPVLFTSVHVFLQATNTEKYHILKQAVLRLPYFFFCFQVYLFIFILRFSLNSSLLLFCHQIRNSSADLAPDKRYRKEAFFFGSKHNSPHNTYPLNLQTAVLLDCCSLGQVTLPIRGFAQGFNLSSRSKWFCKGDFLEGLATGCKYQSLSPFAQE